MALWQTRFFVIKESNIVIEAVNEEEILLWGNTPLNSDSLLRISKTLYQEKSWSAETIQYGKIDGTCLEISYNGNIVSEISLGWRLIGGSAAIFIENSISRIFV